MLIRTPLMYPLCAPTCPLHTPYMPLWTPMHPLCAPMHPLCAPYVPPTHPLCALRAPYVPLCAPMHPLHTPYVPPMHPLHATYAPITFDEYQMLWIFRIFPLYSLYNSRMLLANEFIQSGATYAPLRAPYTPPMHPYVPLHAPYTPPMHLLPLMSIKCYGYLEFFLYIFFIIQECYWLMNSSN